MMRAETTERPADVLSLNILCNRGRTIRPKTLNQKRYVDSIDKHTITFGIGPAGTGKTYLAMAKAVQALQAKDVSRIILTRPAVEAGERLGFLPGTLSREDRPLPAPVLRRAARHGRPGHDPQAAGGRHHRGGPPGVHARTHPQRRVHHPGRGSEHLARADEDVPHPPRLRLQDRRDRRHQPGRPAGAATSPGCAWSRASSTGSRTWRSAASPAPTSCATGSWAASWRRTTSFDAQTGPPRTRATARPRGGPPDEHRGPQRVRAGARRTPPLAAGALRHGPDARPPPGRAVHQGRRRGHHRRCSTAQWMEKDGPTDVLAFPMDELRPGKVNEEPEEGVLGDLVLCPTVAERQGEEAGHGTRGRDRPAHRPRHPPPPRLRPRRARGARGDVRPPGRAPGGVGGVRP